MTPSDRSLTNTLFLYALLASLHYCSAQEVTLPTQVETITGDSEFSSCGLEIGDPITFTVGYDQTVSPDFADSDLAIFSNSVDRLGYQFEGMSGNQTAFNQNTIATTDQLPGGGEFQFANLRLTSPDDDPFELDLTAMHAPPENLISDIANLESFPAIFESYNDALSGEFWFRCTRPSFEGLTFLTITHIEEVPEPRHGMFVSLSGVLMCVCWLRSRHRVRRDERI